MRASAALATLVAALFWQHAGSVKIDVENGVYKLEEATFDTVLKKFPAVMVKFYAPWCGHCKAMQPDYEKAARKLKKEDDGAVFTTARLAKVDATAEGTLSRKFGVEGFPTLLVFKDGELFDTYRGGREKDDIFNYMTTMAQPTAIGACMRVYFILKSPYKELVRAIPIIPGHVRKHVFAAFPAVLATPFVLLMTCMCCCCGGSSTGKKGERKGRSGKANKADSGAKRPAGRSSSPGAARPGKKGEAPSGKDGKDAEPKDGDDKKDD